MKHTLAAILLPLVLGACDAVRPLPSTQGGERVIEAAIFEGGYGTHWHRKIAERFCQERTGEGIRVKLWGDPRLETKVKPRILRGDPPEVVLAPHMPLWLLARQGKLYPFNSALAKPAIGGEGAWGEAFMPGMLDGYASEGTVYAIPSAFNLWSCWYNARLFREHGWQVPKTWGEFDRLCADIRAAGIDPIAFQGKYPLYAWWTFTSLVQRQGGLAAINRLNALERGAFLHEDVIRAARLLQEMALRHYQKGAMAMTHTESQLQFVNNHAAMIFCGLWLENEMKVSTPPEFELRCFNIPAVEGGKGNPRLINGEGGEFVFVSADSRYPEDALEFIRYMISPLNAPDMGASIGVISPLRGATPRGAVSPPLQSALDVIEEAPGLFSVRHWTLLLEWTNNVMVPALAALMRGAVTPEVFCQTLEDGIAAELAKPGVFIPPAVRYDPAAFGENL